MPHSRQKSSLLILLLGLGLTAHAYASPAVTLGERAAEVTAIPDNLGLAFEQALQNRLDLRLADGRIKIAELGQEVQQAMRWPQAYINWNSGKNKNQGYIDPTTFERQLANSASGQNFADNNNTILFNTQTLSFGVSYLLYTGGEVTRASQSAALLRQDAGLDKLQLITKVLDEVGQAYFQLKLALLQEQFGQKSLRISERKMTEMAFPRTSDPLIEKQNKAEQLRFEVMQMQAQRNQLESKDKLRAFCNVLAVEVCPKIDATDWLERHVSALPGWLSALLEEARNLPKSRYEVAKALRTNEMLDARSAYLPHVWLDITRGISGNSGASFSGTFRENRSNNWQINVSMNWTLFDGFSASNIARQASQRILDVGIENKQALAARTDDQQRKVITAARARLNCKIAHLEHIIAHDSLQAEVVRHQRGEIALHALQDEQLKYAATNFAWQTQLLEIAQAELALRLSGLPANVAAERCGTTIESISGDLSLNLETAH